MRAKTIHSILLTLLCGLALAACQGQAEKEPSYLERARQAYSKGAYFKAEGYYEDFLQSQDSKPDERFEAWLRLWEIASNIRGDRNRSVEILEAMRIDYGENNKYLERILWLLADQYGSLKQWQNAEENLIGYLNLQGLPPDKRGQAQLKLAGIYAGQKKEAEARAAFQACREGQTDKLLRARCMYEEGVYLSLRKQNSEAGKLFAEILAEPEVKGELRGLSAFALAELKEAEEAKAEALALYQAAMADYPNPKAVEVRLKHLNSGKAK